MKITEIIKICNAIYLGNDYEIEINNFSIDTRTIKKGDIYIGIKGKNYDGNIMYDEAFKKGAKLAILNKETFNDKTIFPILLVDDTILALKKIAAYLRRKSDAIFIGITGSVGKTSTKELIYQIVSKKYNTLKAEKNFNNHIGLPLTLAKLKNEEVVVLEMGMNHSNEIKDLSKIVKPNIGIITNIGTAHIGNLGSRKNILNAKLEILKGMDKNAILIINNDNDLLHKYYLNNENKNIITIGINNKSDVMASNIVIKDKTTYEINYHDKKYLIENKILSKDYIYNSLIGFAVGKSLNIPDENIITSIKEFKPNNRIKDYIISDNINIIDDTYNASVDSMKSSIEILKNKLGKRKIAVLGDMLELGNYSKKMHKEIGHYAVKNNIDILITVGEYAQYIADGAKEMKDVYILNNNEETIKFIKSIMKSGDVILIKASNKSNLKEIVHNIIK